MLTFSDTTWMLDNDALVAALRFSGVIVVAALLLVTAAAAFRRARQSLMARELRRLAKLLPALFAAKRLFAWEMSNIIVNN